MLIKFDLLRSHAHLSSGSNTLLFRSSSASICKATRLGDIVDGAGGSTDIDVDVHLSASSDLMMVVVIVVDDGSG